MALQTFLKATGVAKPQTFSDSLLHNAGTATKKTWDSGVVILPGWWLHIN